MGMKILLISAAVVLPLGAAFFSASGRSANHGPSVFVPVTKVLSAKMPALPPPGIYLARPYSGIVVVPRPIDNGLLHVPPSIDQLAFLSAGPPLHFEPMR